MADERDGRWLDEAAAEKLLRGEPLEPVGPAADPRARAEAARLRAALDSLARPQPPSDAQAREAAAMAAFRSARGARRPAADLPHAVSYAEPLIEIGHVASTPTASAGSALTAAPAFRRGRAVRFGLAAALASVTVGGLAAVAAAGLLGQERYDSAGPGPAMSVSVDEEQAKGVGSGAPTLAPKDRRTPHRGDGAVPGTTSGATQSPGASGRTSPGASATGEAPRAPPPPAARTGTPGRARSAAGAGPARPSASRAMPRRATGRARTSDSRPWTCARTTGRAASPPSVASASRSWPAGPPVSRPTASRS